MKKAVVFALTGIMAVSMFGCGSKKQVEVLRINVRIVMEADTLRAARRFRFPFRLVLIMVKVSESEIKVSQV